MFGLEDKVIFVTGGNRGIGAAIVEILVSLGAKVAYTYRSNPGPPAALAMAADVTDPESMTAAVDRVEREVGAIYGAVLNAGITKDNLFPKISVADWYTVIDTNLNGVFNTLHPLVPKLYERGSGSLVFISSVVGEAGNIGQANYAASKSAVIGLAKTLGLECALWRAVKCGGPRLYLDRYGQSHSRQGQRAHFVENSLRRFAEPEEIGWATAFLLSPTLAGYITGEVLSVNGGQYT